MRSGEGNFGGRQAGFTIMELMIGLAVGLILLVGLVASFASSQRAQKEMARDAEQIENGRMALEILQKDLSLAGYYHNMYTLAIPASMPDDCEEGDDAAGISALLAATGIPASAWAAADDATKPAPPAGSTCVSGGILPASQVVAGSDVLVVRRAGTMPLESGDSPIDGELYLQTGAFAGEIQVGDSAVEIDNAYDDGDPAVLQRADGEDAAGGMYAGVRRPEMRLRNPAEDPDDPSDDYMSGPISKYLVRIYFVAPCSNGTGAGGFCQAGDDQIPTLKRLDLLESGGVPGFQVVPLVEGIQAIVFDWGVDTFPATVSDLTGFIGDGQPDGWMRAGMAVGDWGNVTGSRVWVLARSTSAQPGHNDDKTYEMGLAGAYGPYNDAFRRHVYTSTLRMDNMAKRRELP